VTLQDELAGALGPDAVTAGGDATERYEHDLTGRFSGRAALLVRPADTAAVAELIRSCDARRMAVCVQGGNTGMVGGQIPLDGELLMSLERLDRLDEVNPDSGQVTVGAGVRLETLQRHVAAAGFEFPVDHGGRSGATIGGMVATNAGGTLAARFGSMRAQVLGLEAVLADGTVVRRLAGLLKDNAGYDWPGLLVGSEGTLGVVTEARLRLRPAPAALAAGLFALRSAEDGLALLRALRRGAPSLRASDFFRAEGLELVCGHKGLTPPFGGRIHPFYVVTECGGADPEVELAEAASEVEPLLLDAAVAGDRAGREGLWQYREAHNESVAAAGVPHKLDVSVPIGHQPAFLAEVEGAVSECYPDARTFLYGHLGDGNVHVNVIGPDPEDESVDDLVLELVARHGGSISAEHGVGIAKTRWLSLTRSPEEIRLMRAVKAAVDPHGILSPGRVFPRQPE